MATSGGTLTVQIASFQDPAVYWSVEFAGIAPQPAHTAWLGPLPATGLAPGESLYSTVISGLAPKTAYALVAIPDHPAAVPLGDACSTAIPAFTLGSFTTQ